MFKSSIKIVLGAVAGVIMATSAHAGFITYNFPDYAQGSNLGAPVFNVDSLLTITAKASAPCRNNRSIIVRNNNSGGGLGNSCIGNRAKIDGNESLDFDLSSLGWSLYNVVLTNKNSGNILLSVNDGPSVLTTVTSGALDFSAAPIIGSSFEFSAISSSNANDYRIQSITFSRVSEPGILGLMGLVFMGFVMMRRRQS